MAKQDGYIKLKGTLGGLTFYQRNGEDVVKTKSGIDKKRIAKDPAFKRLRENMAEFGGSAKVGKALRLGYASIIKLMSDNGIYGRVTGIMKRINTAGQGMRGQRAFEILNNKALLEGFEFNKTSPLDTVFFAPYAVPVLGANRSAVTWDIPSFETDTFVTAPEGATHFKLVLASTVLSDYVYNTTQKQYEPVLGNYNGTSGVAFSNAIGLGAVVGETTLTLDLGFTTLLPDTAAVINAIGIVFYQEINGVYYELASNNAMRIASVG